MQKSKYLKLSLILPLMIIGQCFAAESKTNMTTVEEIQTTAGTAPNTTETALVGLANLNNSGPMTLDFKTVVGLTLAQNLDIQISETELDRAKADYLGSYAWLLPSLRGQLFFERFTGSDIFIQQTPVDVDRDTFRKRLSADYQIPLGGKGLFLVKAANALKHSKNYALDNTTQKALLESLTQYNQWLRDAAKIQAAEASVEQAKSLVETQKKRQDNGYGMQLDVEQANIQLADRESDKLDVENSHQSSEIVLATTLNIPVSTDLEAAENILKQTAFIDNSATLEELLKIAETQHPELMNLRQQIKAAKAEYQASYSDLLPTVGLGTYAGQVGPFSNQRETISRSISLNYDVLRNMGVGILGNIKGLRSKWQQTILELEKRDNEIERNIADAYFDWQYQQKQLTVAEKKVKSAEEAQRIAKARLTTGFGIQLEILKAQADLAQAKMDYYEAIYQANVSQLRLLYQTGQLKPEMLGIN